MTVRFIEGSSRIIILTLIILLILPPLIWRVPDASSAYGDATITGFFSCDSNGIPLDGFPKNSYAYFNVTVENLTNQTLSLSVHLSAEDELHQSIGNDVLDTTLGPWEHISYLMKIFVPVWSFVGTGTAYASLWSGGMPIFSGANTNFRIIPQDTVPPSIQILSPYNLTYHLDSVVLAFTVSERTSWIGYSLNNMPNVTITGNTTIRNLPNNSYNIAVSANDTSGNMNTSKRIWFTIQVLHDVAVLTVENTPDSVFQGEIVNVSLIVANQGSMPENFNTTLYANETILQQWEDLSLQEYTARTLEYDLNTSDMDFGTYLLSAEIPPLPGETDLGDNSLTNGTLTILIRHEVAVTDASLSKTILGRGFPIIINVTVRNRSFLDENINLSINASQTVIWNSEVFLANQSDTTLSIEWAPNDSFPFGNVTLIAFAEPFPDEVNTTDNTLVAGSVFVTIAGDVTSATGIPDGRVDMRDIGAIVAMFGKNPLSAIWDPNEDINGDFRIDLRDIGIACNNFARTI